MTFVLLMCHAVPPKAILVIRNLSAFHLNISHAVYVEWDYATHAWHIFEDEEKICVNVNGPKYEKFAYLEGVLSIDVYAATLEYMQPTPTQVAASALGFHLSNMQAGKGCLKLPFIRDNFQQKQIDCQLLVPAHLFQWQSF